ncbi:MAG: UDP-N-acetylmuramate:L-alanyl-gamma-D-glutamyl-meso-diaminopimelate ligase, partial [Glaciecola sp.]
IAIIEPRSNTMKMGVHKKTLANSWQQANEVFLFEPENVDWSMQELVINSTAPVHLYKNTVDIVEAVVNQAQPGDQVLIMSNGGFNNIHQSLLTALTKKFKDYY